ncbi:MAG: response regulator [Puniceicoccaceae bacterium]
MEAYSDLVHEVAGGRMEIFHLIRKGVRADILARVGGRGRAGPFPDCNWIEKSPRVIFWGWFPDSTLVCVSRNIEDSWGVPADSIKGARWIEFVQSPAERRLAEEFLRKAVRGDASAPQRFSLTLPGDRLGRFLIHNVPPEVCGNAKVRGSLLVDVSAEERESAKALHLDRTLSSVFGQDPVPMVVFRKDGTMITGNRRMTRLLDRFSRLSGNNVFEVLDGARERRQTAAILEEVPADAAVPVTLAVRDPFSAGTRTVNGRLRRCRWKETEAFLFALGSGRSVGEPRPGRRVARRRLSDGAGLLFRSGGEASYAHLTDDEQTNQQVSLLARAYGATRGYVFEYHSDLDLLSNTVEWCADGVEPQIDGLQHHRFSRDTPWWFGLMNRGSPVLAPSIANLPPEACLEKGILEAQDIKGLAAFPLWKDGKLSGFVGMDFDRSFTAFDPRLLEDLATCARTVREKRDLLSTSEDRASKLLLMGEFFRRAEIAVYRWDCAEDVATLSCDAADILRLPTRSGSSLPKARDWLLRHVHPDDRPAVAEALRQFLTAGGESTRMTYRFTHDFETFMTVEHRLFVAERDERGVPSRAMTFLQRVSTESGHGGHPAAETFQDRGGEFIARLAHDLKTPLHLLENLRKEKGDEASFDSAFSDHVRRIRSIIELAEEYSTDNEPVCEVVPLHRIEERISGAFRDCGHSGGPVIEADPGLPGSISIDLSWVVGILRLLVGAMARRTRDGFRKLGISLVPIDERRGWLTIEIGTEWADRPELGLLCSFRENLLSLGGEGSVPELELALHRLVLIGGKSEILEGGLAVSIPCEVVSWNPENRTMEQRGDISSVLLVEDHDLIRKVTYRQLEKAGFDVTAVANGREAVSWLKRNPADVVLLDIQMPVMNGFQFLDHYWLPDFEPHRAKKGVYVVSALEGSKNRRELEQYPILGFLSKPFSVESFVRELQSVQG